MPREILTVSAKVVVWPTSLRFEQQRNLLCLVQGVFLAALLDMLFAIACVLQCHVVVRTVTRDGTGKGEMVCGETGLCCRGCGLLLRICRDCGRGAIGADACGWKVKALMTPAKPAGVEGSCPHSYSRKGVDDSGQAMCFKGGGLCPCRRDCGRRRCGRWRCGRWRWRLGGMRALWFRALGRRWWQGGSVKRNLCSWRWWRCFEGSRLGHPL